MTLCLKLPLLSTTVCANSEYSSASQPLQFGNVINEPAHEGMALFVLPNIILQTRMRSHPMGLDVSFSVGPLVYFRISCVRTAKALARLRGCAGSPEPSPVAYVISTKLAQMSLVTRRENLPSGFATR